MDINNNNSANSNLPNNPKNNLRTNSNKKTKKKFQIKFDREGFYLSFGIGTVSIIFGLLIIWATITAPEGESHSTGFTTAQRIARLLPQSTQNKIAFVLAVLFVLFGILLYFAGTKAIIKYFIDKVKNSKA